MEGGTTHKKASSPGRRRRAWWQWVIALLLFGGVGLVAVYSYVPGLGSNPTFRRAKLREIRISPDLKPSEVVPAAPGELAGCNVLIVTYDTTRADHIGIYGNDRVKTPAIDRIAREGVLFSQAVAPAPTTLPSHASLMTGLYPHHHGARANNTFRLEQDNVTLAEILADRGYATGAFVSAFVLDGQFGIDQGFQDYDAEFEVTDENDPMAIAQRSADQTNERAESWLRQHAGEKFVLWVHYYDPHFPYEAPKPFSTDHQFAYDAEIAFADFHMGRLLALLDELNLTDRTLVVVAGDHGEGRGQHDEWFHACLIYESTMHVPLVMRCGTRLGGGVHVSRPVSLVDVMPTILSLLGIDAPDGLDGVDLTRPPAGPRPIFVETLQGLSDSGWAALLGVRVGSAKYIYGPDSELYDLSKDPFETDDQLESQPELAAAMLEHLHAFYGENLEAAATAEPTHQVSGEDLAKLQALGYLGTMTDVQPRADRPHPRDMMPLQALISRALMQESRLGEDATIARLEEICQSNPTFANAWRYLGDKYVKKGNLDAAEEAYNRLQQLRPATIQPIMALADIATTQRRVDDAIELYREVLTRDPGHFNALLELGRALRRKGEFNDAAEVLVIALAIRPRDRTVPDLIAETMSPIGRADEAIELFQRHLEAEPDLPTLRNTLAGMLARPPLLKWAEAIAILEAGIELDPEQLELVNNLAFILAFCPEQEIRHPITAVVMMEKACEQTGYRDPRFMHTLSMIYAAATRYEEAVLMAERARDVARAADDERYTMIVPAIGLSIERFRAAQKGGLKAATLFNDPASGQEQDAADPSRRPGSGQSPQTADGQ